MSKSEIQYFLTFAAGIAAFWLSNQAAAHVPAGVLSFIVSVVVYGLGMAILAFILVRKSLPGIVVSTILAMVLAVGAAQLLVHTGAGHIHSTLEFALFTFVSYVLYGLIFVVGSLTARRLAR